MAQSQKTEGQTVAEPLVSVVVPMYNEEEGIDLHLVAMSAVPPIFYWSPGTVEVLERVRRLRLDGIEAYSTMDAGPNVHVICRPADEAALAEELSGLDSVREVIRDRVGTGPEINEAHLL